MKPVYFASDLHLGLFPADKSLEREKLFIRWLDTIKGNAGAIFLVGDIFDFWWEYKKVVPRGFVRFLGKIAEITDSGIPVHFFTGNHDLWVRDYLPAETGMIIHRKPLITEINGHSFYIAHGDGMGKGDIGYKLLKIAFHSKLLQWFYSCLHPDISVAIGHAWAKKSRYAKGFDEKFEHEEKERLVGFAKNILIKQSFDFFVFGHRHIPLRIQLNDTSTFINLGDWITHFSYAVFDGETIDIRFFK